MQTAVDRCQVHQHDYHGHGKFLAVFLPRPPRLYISQCVFQVDRLNGGLTLTELAPGLSVEDVKAKTDATFAVVDNVASME